MMADKSGAVARTPARPPPTLRNGQSSSTGRQQSILGFFSKNSVGTPANGPSELSSIRKDMSSPCLKETTKSNSMAASKPRHRAQHITPVPSSDAIEPLSSQENRSAGMLKVVDDKPPLPLGPAETIPQQPVAAKTAVNSSPSRKVTILPLHCSVAPPPPPPLLSCPKLMPSDSGQEDGQLRRVRLVRLRRRRRVCLAGANQESSPTQSKGGAG